MQADNTDSPENFDMKLIFEEVLKKCCRILGQPAHKIYIDDLIFGQYLTVVQLSLGTLGFALTQYKNAAFLSRSQRKFGPFTPNNTVGRSLEALFSEKKGDSPRFDTLKLAAANAVSAAAKHFINYRVKSDTDPYDLIKIQPDMQVSLVGAFSSYIKKLSNTGCRLKVLELDEKALQAKDKKYFAPADQADWLLPKSDIVIITASALANNTIIHLLKLCRPDAGVIITGPSAGLLPDVLFDRGVDIVGSLRVHKPKEVKRVVREGGTGYHLFRYGAEKVSILKNQF